MAELKNVISRCKTSNISLDKLCNIKKYLPIKEKFRFLKEYNAIVEEHLADYIGYESFVAFIFFNLMIVKEYTDIKLELSYDEFDILQEYGLIDKIVNFIGEDYSLLLGLVQAENVRSKPE